MKVILSLVIGTIALPAFAAPASKCVDLSGKYRPAYETDSDDVVTTVSFQQSGCTTLTISGIALGKPHFESETTSYAPLTLSLGGAPAPMGLNCLYNSYPGICASYVANESYVSKTIPGPTSASADPTHGTCFYSVSYLSKDGKGNLVETPQAAKCDDGYQGVVAPVIWPKAN